RPGDVSEPAAGEPAAGDPATGEPSAGAPAAGDPTTGVVDDDPHAGLVRRRRKRGWFKRHKSLTVLLLVALVLLAILIGWLFYLNNKVDDVRRFDVDLGEGRPPQGEGVDFLLMGVDDLDGSRDVGESVYDMLESGTWKPGIARSDTMMVLHLEADKKAAQLVSVPRDSYVDIPGHGKSKINAAFSWGGPELAAKTVEQNLGIRLDHLVIIDFDGFKDVTAAIGGVNVFVPETLTDPRSNSVDWERGFHHLEGDEALHYVRTRYSLPDGDFGRIHRQQNFLRTVLDKLTSRGVLLNPIKVTRLANTLAGLLMVDDGLTNAEFRDLALAGRHLRSNALRFLTIPNSGSAMVGDASVVKVRLPLARKMFDAIEQDQFESWYAKHEVSELPPSNQVK
uniref:LCP family protein n=1 Tax=Nocardioides jensenii TaxID=1843 RepID=UPI00082A34E5